MRLPINTSRCLPERASLSRRCPKYGLLEGSLGERPPQRGARDLVAQLDHRAVEILELVSPGRELPLHVHADALEDVQLFVDDRLITSGKLGRLPSFVRHFGRDSGLFGHDRGP